MDNILNITDRLESKKRKEQIEAFRGRVNALQKIVQCSSCRLRCGMCGHHLVPDASCPSASDSDSLPSHTDLNLCASCRTEFNDFLEMASGKKGAEVFWHNREWMNLWSSWLDYREAIREFRDSPEFRQLNTENES